jgi:hypothetical protein
MGFITAIPLAVRDRYCDCKLEIAWSEMLSRTEALQWVVILHPLELQQLENSERKTKVRIGVADLSDNARRSGC